MRVAPVIVLTEEQRQVLLRWSQAPSLPARQVERARIILLAAAGKQDVEIAANIGVSNHKAARWRKRFLEMSLRGLERDAPRLGRIASISKVTVDRVIELTTLGRPNNAKRWSTRAMAAEAAISEASVRRIWRAHGLRPHLAKTALSINANV